MADPTFNTTPIINPFGLTDAEFPVENSKFTLADIDGDGDLDAFIGNSDGVTQFFRNTGTTQAPSFVEETSNFGLSDVGTNATPSFVDIDNDGDLDAFSGNGNGTTQFFRNIGTANEANFVSEANNFGLPKVLFNADTSFVDIDGDGDLDAFISNDPYHTQFLRNNGTASDAKFIKEAINFGLNSFGSLTFVDIDGDGDQDAFNVEVGIGIHFYRNIGTINNPKFVTETKSFGLNSSNLGEIPNTIKFTDIDGDGDLDTFIGGNTNTFLFLNNKQPTLTEFTAPVTTGEEDTLIKLTFEQLLAMSNATDADGSITAFVVNKVLTGGLAIGTSLATATNWAFRSKDTIDATHFAYWRPPTNASGSFNAFELIAKDNDGGLSAGLFAPGVPVQINVTAVNDAPTLSTPFLFYNDTQFVDVFSKSEGFLTATDPEGDAITYGINCGIDNGDGTVSKSDPLGLLTINKTTGAYAFIPNASALEALGVDTNFVFSVTASDGLLTTSKDFTIFIAQGDIFFPFPPTITETNGDDILTGTTGSDKFNGLAGNDVINGLQGNDVLIGDQGNDILDGGAGMDWASYSTATGPVSVNLGIVGSQDTENAGLDTLISIENLIGSNFDDILIGNDSDNVLIGGLGSDILIGGGGIDTASYSTSLAAVYVNLANTSQQNTLAAGVDTLRNIENLIGSRFNDTLVGNAGDNILTGGLGNDDLNGEDGSDTASYRTATAGVTVNLAIAGQQNTVSAGLDTLSNIENLAGSFFDDNLNGNTSDNSLIGDLGNDILDGDQGNDFLDGGLGIDAASYVSSSAGVTVNLGIAGQQNTISAGVDTLRNIENLIGSNFNDTLIGSSAANSLIGGLGDDVLINGTASYITSDKGVRINLSISGKQNTIGAGFDTLTNISSVMGSNFNDTLIGSTQESTLIGGLGNDMLVRGTASYLSSTAGVSVNLSVTGQQNTISAGLDTLINVNNLIGSNFNDILIGNSRNNIFTGGLGNDFIDGGDGNDWVSYAEAKDFIDVRLEVFGTADSYSTGHDRLDNIENVIGTDFGDFLRGNSKNNSFIGGKGNDLIDGKEGIDTADYSTAKTGVKVNLGIETQQNTLGAGLDTLLGIENIKGSDFNDILIGNAINNLIVGGLGDDVIDGKEGRDTVSYSSVKTGVKVNLGISGQQNTEGAGKDTLISIENLVGSQFNDTLIGNAESNVIEGNLGNDFINGGDGIDWAFYSSAQAGVTVNLGVLTQQDTVNAGLDTLINIENLMGSQYDDTLTGNAASNIVIGGLGNDIIDGGDGIDTISYFKALAGVTVDLSNTEKQNTISAGFDTLSNIENIIGSDFNDTLIGNNNDNAFIGGLGRDKVLGGGGFDKVSYERSESSILVLLNQGLTSVNKSGDFDNLTSIESIVGSQLNDSFIINNTEDKVINGGNGIDSIGFDVVFPEIGTRGVTINLSITGKQNTIIAGLDTFINIENLSGTSLGDTLTGNSGINRIYSGWSGADTINGKAGNDILIADENSATTFVFDTALNVNTNVDTIIGFNFLNGFNLADDTLNLSKVIFTKFTAAGALSAGNFVAGAGAKALDNNDYLLYDTDNGSLYYDADGNGAGAKIEFVSLTGIPSLTADDIVIV